MTQDRASLEEEIHDAEDEVALAEDDLCRAEDRLDKLEEQLASLPPENADEELFYARRDPRQIPLPLELRARRRNEQPPQIERRARDSAKEDMRWTSF